MVELEVSISTWNKQNESLRAPLLVKSKLEKTSRGLHASYFHATQTHHVNVRFDKPGCAEGVVVVDVYPDRNSIVIDGAQVGVGQLREWVRAIRLHLQYLAELNIYWTFRYGTSVRGTSRKTTTYETCIF